MSSKKTKNGDDLKQNLKGIIRVGDYYNNSIRECQIATCYENSSELYVNILKIYRTIQKNEAEFEYKFQQSQNYRVNF